MSKLAIGLILLILLIILGVFGILWMHKKQKQNAAVIQELKSRYENALASKDKVQALQAGRAYYQALRRTKTLTVYDEQAIANDLTSIS